MVTTKILQICISIDHKLLCKLAEKLGYGETGINQLQNSNGTFVSSLLKFFDDFGATEAVTNWVIENHNLPDEDDDVESCPNCHCYNEECEC